MLGLLALSSVNVVVFASLLLLIKLIEVWSSWPFSNLVRLNTHEAEAVGPDEELSTGFAAAIDAARTYYLRRPWVQSSTIVVGVIATSLSLAAYSAATTVRQLYVEGTAAAMIGVLAAMALNESVTWRWRRRYRRALSLALEMDADEADNRPARGKSSSGHLPKAQNADGGAAQGPAQGRLDTIDKGSGPDTPAAGRSTEDL